MDASASRETAPSREARRRSSRRDVPDSTRGRPRPPLHLWSLDSRPRRPRPRICTRPGSVAGDGGSGGPPWRLHPGRAVTAARSSRSSKPTATTASDRRDRRDRRDRQGLECGEGRRPGSSAASDPFAPWRRSRRGTPLLLATFPAMEGRTRPRGDPVMVCTRLLAQQDVDTPAAHDPTANLRSGQAIRGLDRLGRRHFLLGDVTSLPDSDVECRPRFGHDRPDGGIGPATSASTAAFGFWMDAASSPKPSRTLASWPRWRSWSEFWPWLGIAVAGGA